MQAAALVMVLLSAGLHLYWNGLVKANANPALFTLWIQGIGAILALPFGLALGTAGLAEPRAWLGAAISGAFYAIYYTALAGSYRAGALSTAYPIVRGVAPAGAAAFGILAYREAPTTLVSAGIALVCLAVAGSAWIDFHSARQAPSWRSSTLALLAGVASAGYLVNDKVAISYANPMLYIGMSFGLGFVFQAIAMRMFDISGSRIRLDARTVGLAALACVGGYALILTLLARFPVSTVVPLRAVSVVISVYAGGRFFGERATLAKYLLATAILVGILAITAA